MRKLPAGERARRHRERQRVWHQANREQSKAQSAKWRKENPERSEASSRNARLKANFGITIVHYDAMLARQGGVCAICERPPKSIRLSVEHDHGKSKRVRGLTCHFCNRYRIGNNTAETARKVLAYLESSFDGRNILVPGNTGCNDDARPARAS